MKENGLSNGPVDIFLPVLQATILKQQGKPFDTYIENG